MRPFVNRPLPIVDRFWNRVDKRGPDECWLWQGKPRKDGYGAIGRGRSGDGYILVHRFSYELHNGLLGEGMYACHTCDVRLCVNPKHLFEGTHLDNMADRDAKGRVASGEKSGRKLHPESTPRGSANGLAKLRESDIPKIRLMYDNGGTMKGIARQYGLDSGTIRAIVKRRTWLHVPEFPPAWSEQVRE